MSRSVSTYIIGSVLLLAGGAQAWAGGASHGGVGVGIHIAYHTPPTAQDGVQDAAKAGIKGRLSALPAAAGQTLVFSIVTRPSHGTASLLDPVAGTFTYIPDPHFQKGVDSFTFLATDNHGVESNIATETLLLHVSTRALAGQVATLPDTVVSGSLAAENAFPGELLTYELVDKPASVAFSLVDAHTGAFTYTPPLGFTGKVAVKFRILAMHRHSNVAAEDITVTAEPATALAGSVQTRSNREVGGTLSAHAVFAGQTVTFQVAGQAAHGKVMITDASSGTFLYTPDAGYVGSDSFQFRVTDQNGTRSVPAVESVTVHP